MIIICCIAYFLGYALAFSMLRVEISANRGEIYTRGDRAAIAALSLLSWVMVIVSLIRGWLATTNRNGYWDQPVVTKTKTTKVSANGQPDKVAQN